MISLGYKILVIGGKNDMAFSKDIYELDCRSPSMDWTWKNLTQKLKYPREYFVAFVIPTSLLKGTCNVENDVP